MPCKLIPNDVLNRIPPERLQRHGGQHVSATDPIRTRNSQSDAVDLLVEGYFFFTRFTIITMAPYMNTRPATVPRSRMGYQMGTCSVGSLKIQSRMVAASSPVNPQRTNAWANHFCL